MLPPIHESIQPLGAQTVRQEMKANDAKLITRKWKHLYGTLSPSPVLPSQTEFMEVRVITLNCLLVDSAPWQRMVNRILFKSLEGDCAYIFASFMYHNCT